MFLKDCKKAKPFQILSLSGGGFRGLYTARILEIFEEKLEYPIGRYIDLLAGTSIGGILALAVASEIPMKKIVRLFIDDGHKIFKKRSFWQSLCGIRKSPYTSEGLHTILKDSSLFGDKTLADVRHPVIIPSINYTTGKPVVFKTPHHTTFKNDYMLSLADIALATAAAPSYFPRYCFNKNQYVDGGLFANNPSLLALHEASYYFEVLDQDISLLSIGTMSSKPNVNPKANRNGGGIDWADSKIKLKNWPQNIVALTLSIQEQAMKQMVEHRLGKASGTFIYLDDDLTEKCSKTIGLDLVTSESIESLIGYANERAKIALADPKLETFFSNIAPPVKWFNGPHKNF